MNALSREMWLEIISYIPYYQITIRYVNKLFKSLHEYLYGNIEIYWINLKIPYTMEKLQQFIMAGATNREFIWYNNNIRHKIYLNFTHKTSYKILNSISFDKTNLRIYDPMPSDVELSELMHGEIKIIVKYNENDDYYEFDLFKLNKNPASASALNLSYTINQYLFMNYYRRVKKHDTSIDYFNILSKDQISYLLYHF